MLKSARWSSTRCNQAMASSGRVRILLFILLIQVFTGYALAQDFVDQFSTGLQYPGSDHLDQYAGNHYPGFQFPFSYPQQPGPAFHEDDLTVLVGKELEVPYPLYKQISESFLSTTNILVLLPNNTIVQVSGYAGLNDVAQVDPDDTKVLISSDKMIPAAIYLRIILIHPEEVMVRLPDGQILPNQIYQERYGKKVETQNESGQTYFRSVLPKDSFPFLVANDAKSGLSYGNPLSPFDSKVAHHVLLPAEIEVPVDEMTGPVPSTPLPFQEPIPSPEYPKPRPVQYPEPYPLPHYPEPVSVPQYSEPKSTQPYLGPVLNPYYPEPKPKLKYPGPVSTIQSLRYPEHKTTPRHYHPRPSYLTQKASTCVEPRRPASEQTALLPSGVHFMDTSRCSICDPASEGVHVRVFNV